MLAIGTSGRWVQRLTDKFSEMTLSRLSYEVTWRNTSLNWSKVTDVQRQGVLCGPMVRTPLLGEELTERRRRQRKITPDAGLLSGDPLSQRPAPKPRAKGRCQSGRRGGRGGRGQGSVTVSNDDEPPEALPTSGSGAAALDAVGGSGHELPRLPRISQQHAGNPHDADEYDMFDIEHELEGLLEDEVEELQATFDSQPPAEFSADFGEAGASVFATAPDEMTRALDDAASEEAEVVGLHEGAVAPSASTDAVAEAMGAQPLAPIDPAEPAGGEAPPSVYERFSVSAVSGLGYVYHDGRSILRIQRNKPKGSCSVKCYRHSQCSFLTTMAAAPSDEAIIEWAFEVPAATLGGPLSEGKALGLQHVRLADRWKSKRGGGSAKSGGATASSSK